jgi:hypothetical protein
VITLCELLHDIQIEIDRLNDNRPAQVWLCNLYDFAECNPEESTTIHRELVQAIVSGF